MSTSNDVFRLDDGRYVLVVNKSTLQEIMVVVGTTSQGQRELLANKNISNQQSPCYAESFRWNTYTPDPAKQHSNNLWNRVIDLRQSEDYE